MSTRVVLLRHAKPLSEGHAEDALRPLSEEGIKTQQTTILWLKENRIVPSSIFSSPLLRAKQTANLIAEAFDLSFQEEEALSPDFDPEKLVKDILFSHQNETCFFIGHEPTLSQFARDLTGEDILPQGLSKSSACVIEFDEEVDFGKGSLLTLYSP